MEPQPAFTHQVSLDGPMTSMTFLPRAESVAAYVHISKAFSLRQVLWDAHMQTVVNPERYRVPNLGASARRRLRLRSRG
jgi:hypothetical protein